MIKKFFRTLIGIALLPVAFGVAESFYNQISSISIFSSTLHVLERGVLVYLLFHVLIARPAYIYVLGHEVVHVLATWICGGHVVSFNVTPSGGNVITSKTNFFIELSPYFIPVYTILLGFTYILLKGLGKSFPHMPLVFIFFIGVTLAFHFAMTTEVIKMQQPDIVKSGLIFSLIVILVVNLMIVMAVFCPLFDLSFIKFIKSSVINSGELYISAYSNTLTFVNTHKFW